MSTNAFSFDDSVSAAAAAAAPAHAPGQTKTSQRKAAATPHRKAVELTAPTKQLVRRQIQA